MAPLFLPTRTETNKTVLVGRERERKKKKSEIGGCVGRGGRVTAQGSVRPDWLSRGEGLAL